MTESKKKGESSVFTQALSPWVISYFTYQAKCLKEHIKLKIGNKNLLFLPISVNKDFNFSFSLRKFLIVSTQLAYFFPTDLKCQVVHESSSGFILIPEFWVHFCTKATIYIIVTL